MKRENIIYSENFALGFYGVPTHLEKYYGVKIQVVKDHFIKELYHNLDGVDVQAVWLDVDGHNYTSFVFKNDDIKCLFP